MGNSYFLLPLSDGTKTSVYLQQEPQNIYGGNVMSFDRKDPVTSVNDDSLEDILHNPLVISSYFQMFFHNMFAL